MTTSSFDTDAHSFHPAVTDTQPAVTAQNLSVFYQKRQALKDISFTLSPHSLTAIVGPNGGGKSTLLKALMGMLPATQGDLVIRPDLWADKAYLPQQTAVDQSFPLRVYDVVGMGHFSHQGFYGAMQPEAHDQILRALEEVGMADCRHKSLSSLSGGQFQRVLFARLALQDASFILLDEPFTAIDSYTISHLVTLIQKWHQQGKTLVVVSHDIDLVQEYFPHTLLVAQSLLALGPTKEVVTLDHLRELKRMARQLEGQ
jgi:zinc/manganese transport system ATP-binding protein